MTTVDEARAALLERPSDDHIEELLDAFETAIRAEVRDGYAQGMMDGIIEGQRDAEAKLAALREAARYVIQLGNQPGIDDAEWDDAMTALERALAATPAEEERT